MKVGLQIYYFEWPGSPGNSGKRLAEIAKTAESAGFHSLWVMDHFFQLGGGFGPPEITRVEGPMLEGYSTISYLAALTQSVKLGLMITGNIYHHPGLLIKTVTTLDVLSGGRAYFGIGTGWNEREAKGLGVPFPPTLGELLGRLEETLQIAGHMWQGNTSPFKGKYYELGEPMNYPQPLSRPHPPIMIGMWEGGNKMLRLTAKYGDACNLQIGTPLKEFPPYIRERYRIRRDYLNNRLNQLRKYCDEIGRAFDDIERTVLCTVRLSPGAMSSTEIVGLCRELGEMGIQHVIFNMPNVHEIAPLELLGAEVIPAVADLGSSNREDQFES
jgi:alkanesulfonate monooxygenase SsuD/methylene tetrahydromethanopterin reductase-like flavin-dependent oxidoreductase (luciferase family)